MDDEKGEKGDRNETIQEGKRDEEWAHSARIAARAKRWEKVLSGTPNSVHRNVCSQSQEAMQFINVIYGEANALLEVAVLRGPPSCPPPFSPLYPRSIYVSNRSSFVLLICRVKESAHRRVASRIYACMRLAQVCNAGRNASCCSCFLADLSHTVQAVEFSV